MPQSKLQFRRSDRIAAQMQKDLSVLIRQEIPESARYLLGITTVDLNTDYSHATIYVSLISASLVERDAIVNKLNQSSAWLRRCLGQQIRLHHTPELRFCYDNQSERSSVLLGLIDEAVERSSVSAVSGDS